MCDLLSTDGSFRTAFDKVISALKDASASLIAVWGMAGVGKTTLVKEVEKTVNEQKLFKVIKAVVYRTPDLAKIADFLTSNIKSTGMENEKKILIILDDVWDGFSLKAIGIPPEYQNGCKILLTTRCKQVCISMGIETVIQLDTFSSDNEARALVNTKPGDPSTITNAAIELAKKYQGLPIAIVELGRALRFDKALPVDGECLEFEVLEHTYHSLRLSYSHLRKRTTKLCFFLCSLFPQDYVIDVEILTRCAWGLGIYEGIDSIKKVRCEVWAAIENLISSCLLVDHGETSVKMHNLVRRCALWIASQEKILFIPEIGLSLNGTISNALIEGMQSLKVFALRNGHLSDCTLQNLTTLRTLHLLSCQIDDISSLGKLEKLEILSFRGSDIAELPAEIGGLNYLRLLDLFDCEKLQKIPLNLIRKLSQLEELYFNCRSFEEWWFEETSVEGSKARPSESLEIISLRSLPLNLQTYEIVIKEDGSFNDPHKPMSRILRVTAKQPAVGQSTKELRVEDLDDGLRFSNQEDSPMLALTKSTRLELIELPQLAYIWNRLTDDAPSLRSLKVLKIEDCHKLTSLFSFALAERMVCLEKLEIHCCNALKQIITDTSPLCLPRLRTLEITNCGLLEYVFRITTASFALQLTVITIISCDGLDRVIEVENEQTELPHLQRLELKSLENLTTFCSRESSVGLPSLEKLEVEACPKLKSICEIMKNEVKELRLSKVGYQLCKDIIQIENGYFLSSLEKLTLEEISEWQFIYKDGIQIVTLQRLSHLKVFNCNNLRNIFSVQLARNLPQLSHLEVNGCKELDQVVAQDQTSSSSSSSSSMARHKPVCFTKLEEISIRKCNKLRSLFPVSVSHLPKLKKLEVIDASNLKEIFRQDYEANMTNDEKPKEVLLPQLKELTLEKLPRLLWFSTVGYCFIFPASITLRVKCPRLSTRFSVHYDTKASYIRAEIEESKLPKGADVHKDITLGRVIGYEYVYWPDNTQKPRSPTKDNVVKQGGKFRFPVNRRVPIK